MTEFIIKGCLDMLTEAHIYNVGTREETEDPVRKVFEALTPCS